MIKLHVAMDAVSTLCVTLVILSTLQVVHQQKTDQLSLVLSTKCLPAFHPVFFNAACTLTARPNIRCNVSSSQTLKTKFALTKWTKHGITSLLIPRHESEPTVDITIYMDISLNPGPSHENCGTRAQTAPQQYKDSNMANRPMCRSTDTCRYHYTIRQLHDIRRS